MDGQYWKGDQTMSTNEWLLTYDFWQFLEPWHGRWYEYEIFIASCTDNIYDLENGKWLLGDMIDHVGIYGSRVAEGLSAFNVGLVYMYIRDILVPSQESKHFPHLLMCHWAIHSITVSEAKMMCPFFPFSQIKFWIVGNLSNKLVTMVYQYILNWNMTWQVLLRLSQPLFCLQFGVVLWGCWLWGSCRSLYPPSLPPPAPPHCGL